MMECIKYSEEKILEDLFSMADTGYRDFHSKLMPNIDRSLIIGVRMPELREYGKKLYKADPKAAANFLKKLPHKFYEENNLHGILIGHISKTTCEALEMIDLFLPYVNNWATCDTMNPKILKKDPEAVRKYIEPWLDSKWEKKGEPYRTRWAIVVLLSNFLDEEFCEEDLWKLAKIRCEEYYINMAIAWYFSIALIKQYDTTIRVFEAKALDVWVHNKAIQKAIDSCRIALDKKDYLRSLRIKNSPKGDVKK